MKKKLLLPCSLILLISICLPAYAYVFEELCKDGYAVVAKTSVNGDFNGCEYSKRYKLSNGLVFECSEYSYSYGYSPTVYILQNINHGDLKVIIDNREYRGTLYK